MNCRFDGSRSGGGEPRTTPPRATKTNRVVVTQKNCWNQGPGSGRGPFILVVEIVFVIAEGTTVRRVISRLFYEYTGLLSRKHHRTGGGLIDTSRKNRWASCRTTLADTILHARQINISGCKTRPNVRCYTTVPRKIQKSTCTKCIQNRAT